MFWIAVGYLALINLVAFVVVWADKRKAQKGKWRVKEWTMFKLGFAGGVWGLVGGMRRFRHKTVKGSFRLMTALIVITNLGYYYIIIFYLWPML